MGVEKKTVDGIDEKWNKPGYGNVQNREDIRQNLIFLFFNETEKKFSEVHRKKRFFADVKKIAIN